MTSSVLPGLSNFKIDSNGRYYNVDSSVPIDSCNIVVS
jgi:hypothetical protein